MTNPASGNTPPVTSTAANAPASAAAPASPPAAALHPASLPGVPPAAPASPPATVAASAALAGAAAAPPVPLNLDAFATLPGSPASAPDISPYASEAGASASVETGPLAPGASPSPTVIWKAHLASLEQWAQANRKEARNDALAFWALKIPAILVSATAAIWTHYHWTTVSLIAGAVASACVLIDGILPRGILRNIHLRAFFDIRNLMNTMSAQYLSSSAQPANAIRKIIRRSERERQRIAVYLRDAETALKSKPGPG